MKKKNIIITGVAVALLSTTLGSTALAFGLDKQAQKELQNTIQNKDFAAFQKVAPERFQNMSEERFAALTDKALKEKREMHGKMVKENNTQMHQNIQTALDANDYEAFLAAHGEMADTITEKITKENFADFVKMHELRKSGDTQAARALAEELGLPIMQKHMKGKFMGKMKMHENKDTKVSQ